MHVQALLPAAVSALAFGMATSAIPVGFEQQNAVREPLGNLILDGDAHPFTFHYSTSQQHPKNWVGLYAPGHGPINESYVANSLLWEYTPELEGSVRLSAASLEAGDYEAYFLAEDGYRWLADPITVTLDAPPPSFYFPVKEATLHNARRLEAYTAYVGGLLLGADGTKVTFKKTGGDAWIKVASDGTIFGMPNRVAPKRSQVEIRATSKSGSSEILLVNIPVRKTGRRLVEDLKVMTYNMWHGGSQINNYHEKQIRFVLESGADVIGLQESTGGHATRLGQALGWYHWQSSGSVGIISRYPIVEEYGQISRAGGVRINLNGEESPVEINVWSAHLGYTPYGPYDFCFDNMSFEQVLAREAQSGRTPQVKEIVAGLEPQLNNSANVPVILVGDFNAPSHLDWIEALREKNCGVADFPWPTSVVPEENGLIDSFRVVHPEVVEHQCLTWSPLFPFRNGDSGDPEPQDRIDYVYHTKEKLEVVDSECMVAGNPIPSPNHKNNEWTTDHAAVMTHYRLTE